MTTPTARDWYEKTRTLSAFTVADAVKKRKNQHATVYHFADKSQLIVYGKWDGIAWRNGDGNMMARRTTIQTPA